MRRRVLDTFIHQYGTAIEDLGRNLYRVEWDRRTPHQATAKVPIPSKSFVWADDAAQRDGDVCA